MSITLKNRLCSAVGMAVFIFGLMMPTTQVHAHEYTSKPITIIGAKTGVVKNLYSIVQNEVEKKAEEERRLAEERKKAEEEKQRETQGPKLTRSGGVNYFSGWKETWYSSKVLYHYRTAEWDLGADGVYRDSDGYVIVASSSDAQGSIVDTSLGVGKVYDSGCAAGTHDIYTNW